MLRSLFLALLLGDHSLLAARADELQRLPGTNASREVVESELRTFRLFMELGRITRLGGKLGTKLVGYSSDDFEEGLARVADEELFAELLGRLMKFALDVVGDPVMVQRLDAELAPSAGSSAVAARLVEEFEPLSQVSSLPFGSRRLLELSDGRPEIQQAEPEELGRSMLELLYDPAATTTSADFAWAVVRTLGRVVAVRHFETHGLVPSESYTSSLFKDARSDVEQLERVLAAAFDPDPAAIIPFMLDAYKVRANRDSIDEVMEILDERPEAWAEKMGSQLVKRHCWLLGGQKSRNGARPSG